MGLISSELVFKPDSFQSYSSVKLTLGAFKERAGAMLFAFMDAEVKVVCLWPRQQRKTCLENKAAETAETEASQLMIE